MKNIYKWLIDYGLKSHSKFPFNVQIKESLRNLIIFCCETDNIYNLKFSIYSCNRKWKREYMYKYKNSINELLDSWFYGPHIIINTIHKIIFRSFTAGRGQFMAVHLFFPHLWYDN